MPPSLALPSPHTTQPVPCPAAVDTEHKQCTLCAAGNLAHTLGELEQFDEAEATYRWVVKGCKERHGPTHPDTVRAVWNLAVFHYRRGRPAEALPLLREAATGAATNPDDARCRNFLSQSPRALAAECELRLEAEKQSRTTATSARLQRRLTERRQARAAAAAEAAGSDSASAVPPSAPPASASVDDGGDDDGWAAVMQQQLQPGTKQQAKQAGAKKKKKKKKKGRKKR